MFRIVRDKLERDNFADIFRFPRHGIRFTRICIDKTNNNSIAALIAKKEVTNYDTIENSRGLTLILFRKRAANFEIGILGQIARTISGSGG